MANAWYNKALHALGEGNLTFNAGNFKVVGVNASYTPDLTDTGDEFYEELTTPTD